MPKTKIVDFRAVKAAITMEGVLEHYGILDQFKRSGDNLSGPCPIHKGSNPTQFRVSVSKNIWNCFSECKHGGNVLDFIVRMENVSIHAAAMKAIEWFHLDAEAMTGSSVGKSVEDEPQERRGKASVAPMQKPAPAKPAPAPEKSEPNKPLKFRLDKLNQEHPYLFERGLTRETVIEFGIGYCEKGMMAERIAIPIHNVKGEIVAYAGRYVGEAPEGTPKYKLPPGFRKSLELFNIDRAIREPKDAPLVIVEGFFDCMMLHQHGCHKVAALMGSTMSAAQEELIRRHTDGKSQIIVMLDEDEAGQAGRDDIACRISRFSFVRVHQFGKPDMQPDQLSIEEAIEACGGVK
jgi:DNA primase